MVLGQRFEDRLQHEIEEGRLLEPGESVVVAVSGGPDSMTLLHALHALVRRKAFPLRLCVAHLNHRLRGADADRDAHYVPAQAHPLGLPVDVGAPATLGDVAGNVEARARLARTEFLRRVALAFEARSVALGHTRDDQAETVLHRLARGGGVGALAAMQRRRADGWVRPLLNLRRAECLDYLLETGGDSVRDASNLDRRFTRNRIRLDVLPRLAEGLEVDVVGRLASFAADLRVETDLAERWITSTLDRCDDGALGLETLEEAGDGAGRLLHAWLARIGVRPSRIQVEALVRLARTGSPSAGLDLRGGRVERCYESLVWWPASPEKPRTTDGERLPWPIPGSVELASGWRLAAEEVAMGTAAQPPAGGKGATIAPGAAAGVPAVLVDAQSVGAGLDVRRPLPGDRIRLRVGRRKLSDLFIDARIPRRERSSLAVVTRGVDILWVPGIAIDATAVPGRSTQRILQLSAHRVDCCHRSSVVHQTMFRVGFG